MARTRLAGVFFNSFYTGEALNSIERGGWNGGVLSVVYWITEGSE